MADGTAARRGLEERLKLLIPCIAYLGVFGCAEMVTHYASGLTGFVLYLAILLSLLISSAVARIDGLRSLWLALAMVPVIRIAGLTVQPADISEIYWRIIVAVPVLAGTVSVMRALRYSPDDVGLNLARPVMQLLAVLLGVYMGIAGYFLLKPDALNAGLSLESTLFPALIVVASTGFVEELVFRGVMQRAAGVLGSWGWVYIAGVYAILQIGLGTMWHVGFAFGASLVFGLMVKRTGSIVGVSLAHGLINVGMLLVFPHVF